jgi:hypothetical protein
MEAPPPFVGPAADLRAAARSASHVIRGRVRWTGLSVDQDGERRTELRYVVVDILEFHRGDAWSVDPRMRRAFPLLADDDAIQSLACREGEAFFFFATLPGPNTPQRPGGVPDPIYRAFGDRSVELVALVPESERAQVVEALAQSR